MKKNNCDDIINSKEYALMEVLSKPVDIAFIVQESKSNDFINSKKGNDKKKDILQKAKRIEENITYKE